MPEQQPADAPKQRQVPPGIYPPTVSDVLLRREDHPTLPYDVIVSAALEDGRYVIEKLTCRRVDGGEPVTSEGLRRLPVARLLASMLTRRLLAVDEDGAQAWVKVGPDDARAGPTEDALRKVAVVYEIHRACGIAPTRAVQDTFDLPRSTAGRWVAMARERGLLPPASRGDAAGTRRSRGVDP